MGLKSGLLSGWFAKCRAKEAMLSLNFLKTPTLMDVLDIGCGRRGRISSADFKTYVGIDKEFGDDVENGIPYADETFDVVFMLAVIEHIEPAKVQFVLNECNRVLRIGGMILITTPTPLAGKLLKVMAKFGLAADQSGHKRLFTVDEMTKELRDAWFRGIYHRKFQFRLNSLVWGIK